MLLLHRSRVALVILGAAAVLVLDGCDDGNVAHRRTSAGSVVEDIAVTEVKLGTAVDLDMRVTDEEDDFAPHDAVYASVEFEGTAPSATLTARWLLQPRRLIDESSQTVVPATQRATEFHIRQASGLPEGDYRVVILLNGKAVASKEFEVK